MLCRRISPEVTGRRLNTRTACSSSVHPQFRPRNCALVAHRVAASRTSGWPVIRSCTVRQSQRRSSTRVRVRIRTRRAAPRRLGDHARRRAERQRVPKIRTGRRRVPDHRHHRAGLKWNKACDRGGRPADIVRRHGGIHDDRSDRTLLVNLIPAGRKSAATTASSRVWMHRNRYPTTDSNRSAR
jgi:hypothetical protein